MTLQKYLTVFLLLAAVLLVPLNTFAHDVKSEATKSSCACHLADHNSEERSDPSDHYPGSNGGDCCDCDGCCPEATEPSSFCGLRVTFSVKQLFHPPANSFSPKVYLTIFVPPESCSLT